MNSFTLGFYQVELDFYCKLYLLVYYFSLKYLDGSCQFLKIFGIVLILFAIISQLAPIYDKKNLWTCFMQNIGDLSFKKMDESNFESKNFLIVGV